MNANVESRPATVDLLICTRDRADDLAATLASLQHPEVTGGLDVRLTVVDNGSTDATRDVVEGGPWSHLRPRYVHCAEPGLSIARNAALAATDAPLIVFTDDDIRPMPGWLAVMAEALGEGGFDVAAGTIRAAPHLQRAWMHGALAAAFAINDHEPADAEVAMIGANMGFRRSVLEHVPGFDTQLGAGKLGYSEETLFALQLQNAGMRMGRVKDAVVEHHFGADRMTRRAILGMIRKLAHSRVYVNQRYGLLEDKRKVGRAAEVFFKLGLYYALHPWVFWRREGCGVREFKLRNHAAYYLAYFKAWRKTKKASPTGA